MKTRNNETNKKGKLLIYVDKEYNIAFGIICTWTNNKNHPDKATSNKRARQKEKDFTKDDYKERYEIIKKYHAFFKAQREKK